MARNSLAAASTVLDLYNKMEDCGYISEQNLTVLQIFYKEIQRADLFERVKHYCRQHRLVYLEEKKGEWCRSITSLQYIFTFLSANIFCKADKQSH